MDLINRNKEEQKKWSNWCTMLASIGNRAASSTSEEHKEQSKDTAPKSSSKQLTVATTPIKREASAAAAAVDPLTELKTQAAVFQKLQAAPAADGSTKAALAAMVVKCTVQYLNDVHHTVGAMNIPFARELSNPALDYLETSTTTSFPELQQMAKATRKAIKDAQNLQDSVLRRRAQQ